MHDLEFFNLYNIFLYDVGTFLLSSWHNEHKRLEYSTLAAPKTVDYSRLLQLMDDITEMFYMYQHYLITIPDPVGFIF